MKNPPAFQFYPADFLADENVVLMTNREVGCYIKLMCYCWRQGTIPKDLSSIARLCGEDDLSMSKMWPQVAKCFRLNGERLYHKRLDIERQKQVAWREKSSKGGKRSAASRAESLKGGSSGDLKGGSSLQSSSSTSVTNKGTIVPYVDIVSLYHEILPEFPKVKVLSDERKRQIKARWMGSEKAQDLSWWREFFEWVRQSDFLMGETTPPWTGCDLEWLTKKSNFIKVIEGKYRKK